MSVSIEQSEVISVSCALLLNLSFAADAHNLLFKIDGIRVIRHYSHNNNILLHRTQYIKLSL